MNLMGQSQIWKESRELCILSLTPESLHGAPNLLLNIFRERELSTEMSLHHSLRQFVFLIAKSSLPGFEPLDQTLHSGGSENKSNPSSA